MFIVALATLAIGGCFTLPAGPPGPQGATGDTGAKGRTGTRGSPDGSTVVIVPDR